MSAWMLAGCLTAAAAVAAPTAIDVPDARLIVPTFEPCNFPSSPVTAALDDHRLAADKTSSFDRRPETVQRIVNRFHVVRRADGSGGVDENLIDAMMLDLNYGFRNTPFVFVRDPDIVYLDNDTWYQNFPNFQSAFDMISANQVPGIMSWYVTPNVNGAVAGTWILPASPHRGILMAYNTIGNPANIVTPTHEMAHIFQVYHPYETAFAAECANGSNCGFAGDLVCDTPASPRVFNANTTATGIYFGNQRGPCPNDAIYAPNPRLYMDVGWDAGHILRNEFSQGEMDRAMSFLSPTSLYPVADLVGPQRPDILVDCDGNGADDINEILDGRKADLGHDLRPDVCQTFPREGDLIVTGMSPNPNRLRYYDGTDGRWRGDLWNGMSFVHQARTGPDGLVYLTRLNIVQRVDLATGRTVDNFIDGVLQNSGTFVDILFEPDGNILLLDNSTRIVRRYSGQNGAFLGNFFTIQPSGFAPKYMEFGPDGNLYIVGNGSAGNRVLRYDAASGQSMGEFVSAGSGGLGSGQGLVFRGAHLYVSNASANNVLRFDAQTGAFDRAFVSTAGNGGLSNPHSLRFGPDGNLYVASRGTHSVKRYDGQSGAYLGDFVAAGAGGSPGTGGLAQPAGIEFARVEAPPGESIRFAMSGAWANPDTLGQGLLIEVIESRQVLDAGWFTYEPPGVDDAPPPDTHRWVIALGGYTGDTAELDLLSFDGGHFNEASAVHDTVVGHATLRFSSCSDAQLTYAFESGPSGVMPLRKLTSDAACRAQTRENTP
ncbi:MAG: hypothetical protein KDJ14_07815 [Xanthomonadales bacterium]|nr:hypothetical protein [Xanthomonadales bacterium]